jgi:hypothetical protein
MPTVTVNESVSVEQAMGALGERLGVRYKCIARGGASFTVKRSPMTYATVRVDRRGDATVFRIHGGGFIISRLFNELGIARQVGQALTNWKTGSQS